MSKEHANFATLNSMLDYFVLKIRTKKTNGRHVT